MFATGTTELVPCLNICGPDRVGLACSPCRARRTPSCPRPARTDALAGVDRDELEALAAHHGAEAAARGVARRVAVVLVGARDRGARQPHLAGRPDRDERRRLRVLRVQLLAERVVQQALVLVGRDELHALRVHLEAVALARVLRLALHHDRAVAELHQVLAGLPARVRFLDAAGERALAADRDAARRRALQCPRARPARSRARCPARARRTWDRTRRAGSSPRGARPPSSCHFSGNGFNCTV